MNQWTALLIVFTAWSANAQNAVRYHLSYSASGSSTVQVRIDLPSPRPAPAILIMPRGYPGGYDLVLYDSFVEDVRAFSGAGKPVAVSRDPDGPRWALGSAGETVEDIEYSVDIVKMEKEILSAVETSKVRARYLGLLGYSVFAYVDRLEAAKIALQVDGPAEWPVFSTLDPAVPARLHSVSVSASDYYALADSEVLMGPALQLRKFDGAIATVMAVYSEGETDVDLEAILPRPLSIVCNAILAMSRFRPTQ